MIPLGTIGCLPLNEMIKDLNNRFFFIDFYRIDISHKP